MSFTAYKASPEVLANLIRKKVFKACTPDIVPDDEIWISEKTLAELKSIVTPLPNAIPSKETKKA